MTVARMNGRKQSGSKICFIPLSYNGDESYASALRLILALVPQWEHTNGSIEFIRFTDGITNTLLKAVNRRPGLSEAEVDNDAILLRAYGRGTDLIIDRERETQNHELLMQHGLAPPLLARFHNGMLYRFVRGTVTSPQDLRVENVWQAVARRLGQWHAVMPCMQLVHTPVQKEINGNAELGVPTLTSSRKDLALQYAIDNVAPEKPAPNLWTVMQRWIYSLPTRTESERARQAALQGELTKLVDELSNRPGLGINSLVFAHCDLLSGNIILQTNTTALKAAPGVETVSFIDYEYATPSPAAFDIANHFAEWGGFDCDFSVLPTRPQRRNFIREYIRSYFLHLRLQKTQQEEEAEAIRLFEEVDHFRGVPGFYWGIWALIQANISQIDFDYSAYAEIRLGEYRAWREEVDGTRAAAGKDMPLREKRWAQDD